MLNELPVCVVEQHYSSKCLQTFDDYLYKCTPDLDLTCVYANDALFYYNILLCYPLCKDSRKRVDSIAK